MTPDVVETRVDEMADVGGIRRLVSRWVITGTLTLNTPMLSRGRAEYGLLDAVVLRDKLTGSPLFTGASIAGALRDHLGDVLGGYRMDEPEEVSALFGSNRRQEEGFQSALIVHDGIGSLPDGLGFDVRDGVAIDPESGIAQEHKKFGYEILPPGTKFPLRFELLVPDAQQEQVLVTRLCAILSDLEDGHIRLGARKTRGLGECVADEWRVRRFDLSTAAGWREWLRCDDSHSTSQCSSHSSIRSAMNQAYNGQLSEVEERQKVAKRQRACFEIALEIPRSVLIRTSGRDIDSPDASHLTSGGVSVISGTSLAGALRARCLRIANTVRSEMGDGQAWVDNIFGHSPKGVSSSEKNGSASRLIVSESGIEEGVRLCPWRIKIDRFTGGTASSALFEEEPHFRGRLLVRVELRNPKDGEAGLILLALKDLVTEDLPIGGESSVGRGYLRGRIKVRRLELAGQVLSDVYVDGSASPEVRSLLEAEVRTLAKATGDGRAVK